MMKMRIKALFCLVCLLCLSACGKGQEIGVESQTGSQAESPAENQTEPEAETQAETQEEASSDRTHYQNRCPAIGDVDWEAYQRILSDEDYAVLQDFFPVLREEVPFTWTANAYYDEDEAEKRTVTLDEFRYILDNEFWETNYDSDELWLDSIALCDLDRDGGMELILSLANIGGHYLILKEEDGQYYGTDRVYRGFEALQTNGVYVGSGGAAYSYFYRMVFERGTFREVMLGHTGWDNEENTGRYYMGDVETADEEVFQEWLEGILSGDVLYYKPQAKNESSPAEDIFAQIHNEEEYQALVGQLEECTGYFGVRLDMAGSDIPIYLDDLMARRNLTYLTIENGGRITARYMIALGTGSIKYLSLHRVLAVEEEMLRYVPVIDTLDIKLDGSYEGVLPTGELLNNMDCPNIILVWDSQESPELLTEGERCDSISREWEDISVMLKKGKLRGIHRLNDGEYSYTSFDFYRPDSVWDLCGVLISVKDRESGGDKYFDLLEVPEDRLSDADMRCERRIYRQEDLNFDGFKDIIFTGSGDVRERYGNCTVFLWSEQEQKYVFCESAPRDFLWPQPERKRIISAAILESGEEEYHIYEYDGTAFTDRKLVVSFAGETGVEHVSWRYFEEGELRETLEIFFDESNGSGHISYQGNGITKEEELNQEKVYYREIGQEYFPEFDFYWYG